MRSMAQPFDGATNSQMLLTEERLNSMMQT